MSTCDEKMWLIRQIANVKKKLAGLCSQIYTYYTDMMTEEIICAFVLCRF